MYADVMTGSMERAISETNRRRAKQEAYNRAHGIVPKTIIKEVKSTLNITGKTGKNTEIAAKDIPEEIEKLKTLMRIAANALDYERAIEIREMINELRKRMRK